MRFYLSGPFAQRNEFRSNGHAAGYFHTDDRFEWFQLAGVRDGEAQEQLFQRILLADVLYGSLRADGRGACENQNGARRIQTPHKRYHGIIFRQRLIRRRSEILLGFVRFSEGEPMKIKSLFLASSNEKRLPRLTRID